MMALALSPVVFAQDRAEMWTVYCEDGATINSVDVVASIPYFQVTNIMQYFCVVS